MVLYFRVSDKPLRIMTQTCLGCRSCLNSPAYMPHITMQLFGRKKSTQTTQPTQEKPKPKPKAVAVAKYEVSNGAVRFFVAKRVPKKRWVAIKEMPVLEITNVEVFDSEIALTWNGTVYRFVVKNKSFSFAPLRDEIQGLLEKQRLSLAHIQKAGQRNSELRQVVAASLGVVGVSFDILMGLHNKRVNWNVLDDYAARLGGSLAFSGQTMPPLKLDFTAVADATKKQTPKETAAQVFAALKAVYGYFDGLKPEDNLAGAAWSLGSARAAVLAYFALNDFLFGKLLDGKGDEAEGLALQDMLVDLRDEWKVAVDVDALYAVLDGLVVCGGVGDVRAMFLDGLKENTG